MVWRGYVYPKSKPLATYFTIDGWAKATLMLAKSLTSMVDLLSHVSLGTHVRAIEPNVQGLRIVAGAARPVLLEKQEW